MTVTIAGNRAKRVEVSFSVSAVGKAAHDYVTNVMNPGKRPGQVLEALIRDAYENGLPKKLLHMIGMPKHEHGYGFIRPSLFCEKGGKGQHFTHTVSTKANDMFAGIMRRVAKAEGKVKVPTSCEEVLDLLYIAKCPTRVLKQFILKYKAAKSNRLGWDPCVKNNVKQFSILASKQVMYRLPDTRRKVKNSK